MLIVNPVADCTRIKGVYAYVHSGLKMAQSLISSIQMSMSFINRR